MNNNIKHTTLGETLNCHKEYERIDDLSFIFSSFSAPFYCDSFETQMKNIIFFGIISTDKLATTIKDCFSKYFSDSLKNKREINKQDLLNVVNANISPSKITSIGEIKFRLIAQKVREVDCENNDVPKNSQWFYDISHLVNKRNCEIPTPTEDNLTSSF